MSDYIVFTALITMFYLYLGWCTSRVMCKLVWLSNDFSGPHCETVERASTTFLVILLWPFFLVRMGD